MEVAPQMLPIAKLSHLSPPLESELQLGLDLLQWLLKLPHMRPRQTEAHHCRRHLPVLLANQWRASGQYLQYPFSAAAFRIRAM